MSLETIFGSGVFGDDIGGTLMEHLGDNLGSRSGGIQSSLLHRHQHDTYAFQEMFIFSRIKNCEDQEREVSR